MTDEQNEAQAQQAEAYRTMMGLSAWKDFERCLEATEKIAIANEDEIPIMALGDAIGLIGECRGVRKAIRQIRAHIDYRLNGLT